MFGVSINAFINVGPTKPVPVDAGLDAMQRNTGLVPRGPNDPAPRWRLPWLAVGVLALVIAIPSVYAIHLATDNAAVANTAQHFCGLEGSGFYSDAYALLSPQAQQKVSSAQFATDSQKANLSSCESTWTGPSFTVLGNVTSLQVRYTLNVGSAGDTTDAVGIMRLIRSSNGWQVDSLISPLFSLP